jgi:Flp pilus assembly protein TadG
MAEPRRRWQVGRRNADSGAAVVEFVMVSVLLILLLFAVLQVAAVFYARTIIAASAADGARYAAAADVDPGAGGVRAEQLMNQAHLGSLVSCVGSGARDAPSGLATTQVTCAGHLRSFFIPLGAFVSVTVSAHALKEGP